MQPLVSVIIPIYNNATDLARCIESVRKQTYTNLEILLVNDGSVDSSRPICQMYARVDDRIHLINKSNAGVSAARNDGIAAATGKYLQFVDSDDYLPENSVELLVTRAEADACDLVIAHYYRVSPKETTLHGFLYRKDIMDSLEFSRELMDEPASFYYGVLWNKLYRAQIIREHAIQCHEELSWSEDFLFNLEFIRYAKRFAAIQSPVYYYVKNTKSITHTQMDLHNIIKTKAILFPYYKSLYEQLGLYEKYRKQIFKYLFASAEHS